MSENAIAGAVADLIAAIELPGYGRDEVTFMADTILAARPQAIFEWGTNRGSSARIFHETVTAAGLACTICSVDLPDVPEGQPPPHREHPGAQRGLFVKHLPVTLLEGDGLDESVARCDPAISTMFFLDGDHTEPMVARELAGIAAHAPAAVMLLHDTRLGGPKDALRNFEERGRYHLTTLPSQAGMVRLVPR